MTAPDYAYRYGCLMAWISTDEVLRIIEAVEAMQARSGAVHPTAAQVLSDMRAEMRLRTGDQ